MDLKAHYQKIRELEKSFEGPFPVIVSAETPDGGKAGVMTEVPALVAAKMIADGRARLASEDEAREFQERQAQAKRLADQMDGSKRIQLTAPSRAGKK